MNFGPVISRKEKKEKRGGKVAGEATGTEIEFAGYDGLDFHPLEWPNRDGRKAFDIILDGKSSNFEEIDFISRERFAGNVRDETALLPLSQLSLSSIHFHRKWSIQLLYVVHSKKKISKYLSFVVNNYFWIMLFFLHSTLRFIEIIYTLYPIKWYIGVFVVLLFFTFSFFSPSPD